MLPDSLVTLNMYDFSKRLRPFFIYFIQPDYKQTKDTDTFIVWTQGMGSEKYGNGTVQNVNR